MLTAQNHFVMMYLKEILVLLIIAVVDSLAQRGDGGRLEEYFKWKQISYVDAPLQNGLYFFLC